MKYKGADAGNRLGDTLLAQQLEQDSFLVIVFLAAFVATSNVMHSRFKICRHQRRHTYIYIYFFLSGMSKLCPILCKFVVEVMVAKNR